MTTILWLARDFRFHDNEALNWAASRGPVQAVFTLDGVVAAMGSAPRWRLEQALRTFDQAWRARTGQGLMVLRGEAADLLPDLAARIGAEAIVQNDWPWAPQQAAQQALHDALDESGPRLQLFPGHLLIAPRRLQQARGKAYKVHTPFARALRAIGPDRPVAAAGAITALPGSGVADLDLAPDMRRGAAVLAAHALAPGEQAALARLEDFLEEPGKYHDERDRPDLDVCSDLSEHLALGEISPRLIWAKTEMMIEAAPLQAQPLAKFQSELSWREFAWHLLLDFPQMATSSWKADWQDFPWRGDNPAAEDWRRAATGVALVDAGLRQMRVTGRMHNRVRMVVASWLTKHLLTDWRLGEAFFADSLTDWDPAANAMNWQWVAGCGPDAAPFFRIFNPLKQAEQHDPDGRYRSTWLGPGPLAQAYFQAVPPSWLPGLRSLRPVSEATVKAGRELALEALRTRQDPARQTPWDQGQLF